MTDNTERTALVTGATSGLGYEAARQFAAKGYGRVIVTGRTTEKAEAARQRLVHETGDTVFEPLGVDLSISSSVDAAAAELRARGHVIDALVLNAGIVGTNERKWTSDGFELTFASSLVGHHVLTMRLLSDGLLGPRARIVIAGSEAARGDVPTFSPTDLPTLAASDFDGDLSAAAAALLRGEQPSRFKASTTYANTKLFVAWWASALSEKLPDGMAVNAVSPGSAPNTQAARNASWFMRNVMQPVLKYAPRSLGLGASVETAASRYVEATTWSSSRTGGFYASAPKKMTGTLHRVELPHVLDRDVAMAAWNALVALTETDYPIAA